MEEPDHQREEHSDRYSDAQQWLEMGPSSWNQPHEEASRQNQSHQSSQRELEGARSQEVSRSEEVRRRQKRTDGEKDYDSQERGRCGHGVPAHADPPKGEQEPRQHRQEARHTGPEQGRGLHPLRTRGPHHLDAQERISRPTEVENAFALETLRARYDDLFAGGGSETTGEVVGLSEARRGKARLQQGGGHHGTSRHRCRRRKV